MFSIEPQKEPQILGRHLVRGTFVLFWHSRFAFAETTKPCKRIDQPQPLHIMTLGDVQRVFSGCLTMHHSLLSIEREFSLEILSKLNCPCCAGEVSIITSRPSSIMQEKTFKHESSSSQERNSSDFECSVTVLYTK